ncbi:MAG: peptidase [Gammaproteobacteria bacterium]
MRRSLLSAALLVLTLAAGGVAPARAAAGTSEDAAQQAAQMTGGRVLDVRTARQGGRVVYEVKVLLDDGRVRVVRIDGAPAGGER